MMKGQKKHEARIERIVVTYYLRRYSRVLIFVIIAVILFALGLMVGYAVLGEGHNPFDIFSQKKYGIRFFNFIN